MNYKREVRNLGFNIYPLLGYLKKKKYNIHPQALEEVCKRFIDNPKDKGWAWFKQSLIMVSANYWANNVQEESNKLKEEAVVRGFETLRIGDLVNKILEKK